MDQEKKQALRNRISLLALGVLAVAVLLCFGAKNRGLMGEGSIFVVLTVFLVFYWILLDVAEPAALGEFQGMTAEKKKQYLKFTLTDLAGYCALLYFICHIGKSNESAAIGAVIYVFCLNISRKAREQFYNGSGQSGE